jgi:predicted secreted hydrolase
LIGAGSAGRRAGRRTRTSVLIVAAAALVAACSGPILANAPAAHPGPPATPPAQPATTDPLPVAFPRDDGPHDRLTEWWYYTGHLTSGTGRRFGFEFVIFRAERGAFPVSWASHLALTDELGNRFLYGQRSEIGPQVDGAIRGADGRPAGFALAISGTDPTRAAAAGSGAWTMAGSNGRDHLAASLDVTDVQPASAGTGTGSPSAGPAPFVPFGLDLDLVASGAPVLHNRIGYIDFGPAGGSYYYSRPRMTATGTLQLGTATLQVSGTAWFDHQWGDFIAVGGGGWDWFAANLADGSSLTLSLVRDAGGAYPLAYGTLQRADGSVRHLDRDAFSVTTQGTWTSPGTGARYPAGWRIDVPSEGLEMALTPAVAAQELDTRATTGVVYWEGAQRVTATLRGTPVSGEAYVELTGYAATAAPAP